MFGIGMPELLIILVVALIVVGPKKLPDMAKSLGKGLSQFRKAADEIKEEFADNETYQDIKGLNKSFRETLDEVNPKKMLEEVNPLVEAKEPKLDLSGRHALMEDIKGQPGEADKEASIEVARSGESQEASKDPKPAASPSEQDRKES
jgi:Tat protein translocase TatB subunit